MNPEQIVEIISRLNDREQTMLKLFFFIYMKKTSIIGQYFINNPEFPYEAAGSWLQGNPCLQYLPH